MHASDRRRAPGHLSRQGPPVAALGAVRGRASRAPAGLPDRDYYRRRPQRLGGNRACLALARKLLKRSYHTLRELGDDALAEPAAGSGAARRASSSSTSRAKGAANHDRADALAA